MLMAISSDIMPMPAPPSSMASCWLRAICWGWPSAAVKRSDKPCSEGRPGLMDVTLQRPDADLACQVCGHQDMCDYYCASAAA